MYVPGKVVLPDIMIYVRKRKVPRWRKRVQKRMSGFFLFTACLRWTAAHADSQYVAGAGAK